MVERFIGDARNLSCVLKELVTEKSDDEKCLVALFEPNAASEDQVDNNLYQITFIPPNTKHPLQHIATTSKNGFFLLGKAILESDLNEDGEEEVKVSLVELSRRRTERVLVGTPISQEVFYINGSEPLHQGSTSSSRRSSVSRSQSSVYDWSLTNAIVLQPISLDKARYIISLFDYCLANDFLDGVEDVPLWVSVDEKNQRSVTHMATLPTNCPSEKKTIDHVIITCKGPFNKSDNLPNMNSMKTWHNSKCLGSLVENSSSAYALYELLGISQSHEVDQEDQKSLAYVEFTWKDISSVLQPPPLTSDCVLHIQSFPGTMQLSAVSLSVQVDKLCSFIALIANPELSWPELSSDEDGENVHGKMDKVLESLNAGEVYSQTTPLPDDENDKSSVFSPLAQLSNQEFVCRKDLDFTESLWLVLKDAVDFDDLAASLQVALFALLSGTCQPVMHSANKTTLAVFIRELLHCETNEQRYKLKLKVEKMMDNKVALKCLVEIGMEKLLRDHTNYFLSEELVTQDQLSYYMDNKVPLEEKVSRVSKLHNVLDLILTSKCVINTGHTNLQLLTQAALSYYENNSAFDHPIFSISLPAFGASSTSAVKNIITTQQPSVWCLALTSKSKKGELTSIVQLSTESPVNKMPDFLNADESVINGKEDLVLSGAIKSKIPYYLSCARQTMVPLLPSRQ